MSNQCFLVDPLKDQRLPKSQLSFLWTKVVLSNGVIPVSLYLKVLQFTRVGQKYKHSGQKVIAH